jgi:hypothetical protein
MTVHPNRARVDRALKMGGGFFDFEDILSALESGQMQSFSENDSWLVTRVCKWPRKTGLEILFAVGSLRDIKAMEPRVMAFARENSCEVMIAQARLGWRGHMTDGWETTTSIYIKEL